MIVTLYGRQAARCAPCHRVLHTGPCGHCPLHTGSVLACRLHSEAPAPGSRSVTLHPRRRVMREGAGGTGEAVHRADAARASCVTRRSLLLGINPLHAYCVTGKSADSGRLR